MAQDFLQRIFGEGSLIPQDIRQLSRFLPGRIQQAAVYTHTQTYNPSTHVHINPVQTFRLSTPLHIYFRRSVRNLDPGRAGERVFGMNIYQPGKTHGWLSSLPLGRWAQAERGWSGEPGKGDLRGMAEGGRDRYIPICNCIYFSYYTSAICFGVCISTCK